MGEEKLYRKKVSRLTHFNICCANRFQSLCRVLIPLHHRIKNVLTAYEKNIYLPASLWGIRKSFSTDF